MRAFGSLVGSLVILLATGCVYGFAGGGLPSNVRTVALSPFDNQTASPDLPKELYDEMHKELQRRLGLRDAPADHADALVKGVIASYDADVPIAFSANPQQAVSARRRLQVTVDVEIVDQATGKVLYQKKSLRQEADYDERGEQKGRADAISKIVQEIVTGVQSNW
jgi:hypothetical protein